MKRTIIAGTVALLALVSLGSLFQMEHTLLALTSTSWEYQLIRIALMGLLVALLFTAPPRSLHFRTVLGAVSAGLTIGAAMMLSNYTMGIVDALIFIEVAIIFALESIESPVIAKGPTKKIPVTYRS